MLKDVLLIPDKTGRVEFLLRGDTEDTGLSLLQRIYVLFLSGQSDRYRGETGYSLLKFLEGGNTPDDLTMNAILSVCSARTLDLLDPEDRERVQSFVCVSDNGAISATLTLTDGTTLKGTL